MRKFVSGLTLFFVAVFVIIQFIPMKGIPKSPCSLSDPGAPATYFDTSYGVPLRVIVTFTDGCYENQTTNISSFSMEGLLVDISFIVVVGAVPYLVFLLVESVMMRFRPK